MILSYHRIIKRLADPYLINDFIYFNRLERDGKLGALEERADALQDGCAQFEKQAASLKNQFWLENLKSIIAGSIALIILLGLIYWKFFAEPEPAPGAYPPGAYPPAATPAPAAAESGGEKTGGESGTSE